MKKGLIYKATSPSGKIYIGQTTCNLNTRINHHVYESFNDNARSYNYKFHKAIRKYGTHNIVWEILEENIEIENLDEKEIAHIQKFNSYNEGYNSTLGGECGPVLFGENNPAYGKPGYFSGLLRPEHSEKMKGINNPMFGKPCSDERKKKISLAKLGKKRGPLTEETKLKISNKCKDRKRNERGAFV